MITLEYAKKRVNVERRITIGSILFFLILNVANAQEASRRPLQENRESWPMQLPRDITTPKVSLRDERDPEIELLDQDSGRYRLSWDSADGERSEATYFAPDRVEVEVRASVQKGVNREYRYEYEVSNLSGSGQDLFGVAIQTFGGRVEVISPADKYVPVMVPRPPDFTQGDWYWVTYSQSEIPRGTSTVIVLESNAPPGLVNIRAHGGPIVIQGVGEEIPEALMDALPPITTGWPRGITIGPVDDVEGPNYPFAGLAQVEMIDLLKSVGWITEEAARKYFNAAGIADWPEIAEGLAQDAGEGIATSEAVIVLERLTH